MKMIANCLTDHWAVKNYTEVSTRNNTRNRYGKNPSMAYYACFIALALALLIVSLNASQTDDRIVASAQESYVFKTYLAEDSIKISSKDGIVTLTGMVSNPAKMTLAEQTVEELPGVKSVKNDLAAKAEGSHEQANDLIAMKVNLLLLVHPSVSARDTKVTVLEGVVTLRGEATNLAQKELTAEYAEDVAGVKKVENEMTVAKQLLETSETFGGKIDDASITAQIKSSLMWHRSTSAIHTNVETKDAMVTISGIAKSSEERTLVSKIAGDIRGVSTVTNNMTLEGPELSILRQ